MKIAIIGRKKDTKNYEKYLFDASIIPVTTLSMGILLSCDGVLLPGGGDISPGLLGERSAYARHVDTELDILQFHALAHCMSYRIPVIGICKGLQIINVALGGSLHQNLPAPTLHNYDQETNSDRYHQTKIDKGSFLEKLYGTTAMVNSAHHQGIRELGQDLKAIQWCQEDNCIEAIEHTSLPIIGLQWHPERLESSKTNIQGKEILTYLTSLI
jgi:putative glutamine amidotransferase